MSRKYCPEPRNCLCEKIMDRIHKEQRLMAMRRIAVFSCMAFGSVAGFLPSLRMLFEEASRSGFADFASLAFTDFADVMRVWQSFSMEILETLPVIGLMAVLAFMILFLKSVAYLAKDIRLLKHAV